MGMKKISESESVIAKSTGLRTGPLTYSSVEIKQKRTAQQRRHEEG